MKYLGIHKLIGFILIVLWTFWEILCYFIFCVLYLLWCFKWIWNWEKFTETEVLTIVEIKGKPTTVHKKVYDKSIWDTIIRRYKCDFRI